MTTIRPATPADVDGLVACSAALFAEDSAIRDPLRNPDWPADHGPAWFSGLLTDPTALVLAATTHDRVGGHLVGTFAEPSEMWTVARAELVSMYVQPDLRGTGVGGALVDAFVTWARSRGAARLHVTAYATNEPALRLYQRHGFAPLSVSLAADL